MRRGLSPAPPKAQRITPETSRTRVDAASRFYANGCPSSPTTALARVFGHSERLRRAKLAVADADRVSVTCCASSRLPSQSPVLAAGAAVAAAFPRHRHREPHAGRCPRGARRSGRQSRRSYAGCGRQGRRAIENWRPQRVGWRGGAKPSLVRSAAKPTILAAPPRCRAVPPLRGWAPARAPARVRRSALARATWYSTGASGTGGAGGSGGRSGR